MRKFVFLISFVLIFCTFVTACQPTPGEHFVVNKGDGKLLQIINGEPAPALESPYAAYETWVETINGRIDDRLIVEVNADVFVPDVLEYPVYEAVYADYDQEAFEGFLNNTIGNVDFFTNQPYVTDRILYYTNEGDPVYYEIYCANEKEAQQYIDAIDYQLNDRNSPYNRFFLPQCQGEYEKDTIDSTEVYLLQNDVYTYIKDHLSEFMTKVNKEYPFKNTTERDNWETWFIEDGTSKIVMHCIPNEMTTLSYEPNCTTETIFLDNMFIAKTTDLAGVTIDQKSALLQADSWLEKLDLENWELVNVAAARYYTLYDLLIRDVYKYGYFDAIESGEYTDLFISDTYWFPEAYLFTYTPSQTGIPTLWFSNKQNNRYTNNDWLMPYLQVAVDDSGIKAVRLTNSNSGFGKCLNTNVPLLPFEEIQQKFRDYIVMNTDFQGSVSKNFATGGFDKQTMRDDPEHELTKIKIDDVRLGYVKVKKINSNEYMAIPAWCFYGQQMDKFNTNDGQLLLDEENWAQSTTPAGHAFLCINAIDGSIIDLTQGY